MKKIGIISELNLENTNYGNRLQAYALNKYLNENFKEFVTESLYFKIYDKKKYTNKYLKQALKSFFNCIRKVIKHKDMVGNVRLLRCNNFTKKYTKVVEKPLDWKSIKKLQYDIMIVGSDVVWAQRNGGVNQIRFLNFKIKNDFKKISYAASFGKDYIPKENEKLVKKYLMDFDAISVREKSSIALLNKLKINNVQHVCDPTLLLTKTEWKKIEEKVNDINGKFIFVYLLGKSKKQRDAIKKFANARELKIVNIPNANGIYDIVDENFADYNIEDCSPENWIWLINNSEYFFTDSFHGSIFSVIFEKKFAVLKREYDVNINNRMIDFLNNIGQIDKFINVEDLNKIDKFVWDYERISNYVEEFRKKSIKFLKNNIV